MKKRAAWIISTLLMLTLCSCSWLLRPSLIFTDSERGSTENVAVRSVPSELFSENDVADAIETVKNRFEEKTWGGCTLTEIAYAGDERTRSEAGSHADWWQFDQLIVLISSFDTDGAWRENGLAPNATYEDYNWILIRETGGTWILKDWGYP